MSDPQPTIEQARAALRTTFDYPDFRAGQERAIASVLAGRDTLVVLPTGGGKSLCYQVPALVLPKLTVVVSPLISLMKDQVDALVARGVPATFVNSTLSASIVAERLGAVQRGDIKLLYVAPERFDFGSVAERLRATGVSLLAVDEAHCISEWGHDFRPSYLRMSAVRERLGAPPTIALTATATPHVRQDIARQLQLRDPEIVITGFDRTNLTYHVLPTRSEAEKDAALVQVLRERAGLTVVYASTRKAVERIAGVLSGARIRAAAYHAGLDDAHRHEVQDDFMGERVRAIVATNAFGMGIDKPNVRLVVHHAMPGTLEAYYQEAGRAGRDGKPAECVLLHAFQDRFTHEFFIKGAYPDRPLVERLYSLLQRESAADGSLDVDVPALTARLRDKVSTREVESALRLLQSRGAYLDAPPTGTRIRVRLLATAERIRLEVDPGSVELGLLRALWRATRGEVDAGAAVDLAALPSGLGSAYDLKATLDALQGRQFLVWEPEASGKRLADRARPLSAFAIDWEALARRRAADIAKLDAMQQYAYTKGCRRGFVLRYFGDPAARRECAGCDNCLGIRHASSPAATPAKRTRKPARATEVAAMTSVDGALLDRLKTLRKSLARESGVPPYVVFPDRTLEAIAARRPRTLGALSDIPGVGPARLERYGEQFLDAVRERTTA